jgi:hypothetical protein
MEALRNKASASYVMMATFISRVVDDVLLR